MLYIVLGMLNELRPVWFYVLAAGLFVLSQLAGFLLSKVICKVRVPCLQLRPSRVLSPLPIPPVPFSALRGFSVNLELTSVPSVASCLVQNTNAKIDGSFIATILETASVGALYFAWRSITEGP